jgi:hypothetical protein
VSTIVPDLLVPVPRYRSWRLWNCLECHRVIPAWRDGPTWRGHCDRCQADSWIEDGVEWT